MKSSKIVLSFIVGVTTGIVLNSILKSYYKDYYKSTLPGNLKKINDEADQINVPPLLDAMPHSKPNFNEEARKEIT